MEIPYTFAGVKPAESSKPKVAVLPVAYDSTTSYQPGTRFGPQEIILASRFLEHYDEVLNFEPSRLGIVTLPEVWPDLSSPESALSEIEGCVLKVLKRGLFPVILGGEHTITFGAVKAFRKLMPEISVLILDAHADLRESYQGTRYNHACVSRRILEMGIPVTIMGVRSLPSEDLPVLKMSNLKMLWARELKKKKDWLSAVSASLTKKIYLSIDLDFFDPAAVPAVGTPEPGGFGWEETNSFLTQLCGKYQIIGFDIVELNGSLHHIPSAYFASRLAYRLLGLAYKTSKNVVVY